MIRGISSSEFGHTFSTQNGPWLHKVVLEDQIDLKKILPTGGELSFNDRGAPEGLGGPEESIYTLTQFYPGKYLAQNENLRREMGREIKGRYDEYKIRTGKLMPFVGVDDNDKKYAGMGGIFAHGLEATIFMGTVADAEGRLFYLYSPYQGPKLESEQDVRKLQMNREHFPQFTRVPVPTEDIRFLDVIIEDLKEGIIPSQSSSDIT